MSQSFDLGSSFLKTEFNHPFSFVLSYTFFVKSLSSLSFTYSLHNNKFTAMLWRWNENMYLKLLCKSDDQYRNKTYFFTTFPFLNFPSPANFLKNFSFHFFLSLSLHPPPSPLSHFPFSLPLPPPPSLLSSLFPLYNNFIEIKFTLHTIHPLEYSIQ